MAIDLALFAVICLGGYVTLRKLGKQATTPANAVFENPDGTTTTYYCGTPYKH